jgi:predicted GH43/DUF377 family glycosyl hydrolase
MELGEIVSMPARIERDGVVLESDGSDFEIEGGLNPASARTRDGKLLLYPRAVAKSNVSRIEVVEAQGNSWKRVGFALEPQEPYEFRNVPGGYGCEDPRVTFVPLLDAYVMVYTAFGPEGPRIAIALSRDAYEWERLGLVDFSALGRGDDKDGVFFPEPVISPEGVTSFAFYHRPMQYLYQEDGDTKVPHVLSKLPHQRECTRIAYVPLEAALRDHGKLLQVAESTLVLDASGSWGQIKNGAGTPPVRIDEGWLSFFHGVDPILDAAGNFQRMRYSAGIVVHDIERPHIVRYRSPEPVLVPENSDERHGIVPDVVFPTAIDTRSDRAYDVYYGMADSRIGRLQVELGSSEVEGAQESAA